MLDAGSSLALRIDDGVAQRRWVVPLAVCIGVGAALTQLAPSRPLVLPVALALGAGALALVRVRPVPLEAVDEQAIDADPPGRSLRVAGRGAVLLWHDRLARTIGPPGERVAAWLEYDRVGTIEYGARGLLMRCESGATLQLIAPIGVVRALKPLLVHTLYEEAHRRLNVDQPIRFAVVDLTWPRRILATLLLLSACLLLISELEPLFTLIVPSMLGALLFARQTIVVTRDGLTHGWIRRRFLPWHRIEDSVLYGKTLYLVGQDRRRDTVKIDLRAPNGLLLHYLLADFVPGPADYPVAAAPTFHGEALEVLD